MAICAVVASGAVVAIGAQVAIGAWVGICATVVLGAVGNHLIQRKYLEINDSY